MSTLYCLSHAPGADPFQLRLLSLVKEDDGILLIEDGVYAAMPGITQIHDELAQIQTRGNAVYASAPDIEARGVLTKLPTVDYPGIIDLMIQYERIVH